MPSDRRSRKRLATRDDISEAAMRLFYERGFDHVTVDEIAEAADVGRMTVFNHFPRKEDIFFDRDQEARDILRDAVRLREPDIAPIEALHQLVYRLVAEESPYVILSADTQRLVKTIEGSTTLIAGARALRDELAYVVALALAESVGRQPTDSEAHLAAGLFMTTWTVAGIQSYQIFQQKGDTEEAKAIFLALVDQGTIGIKAAIAGTPYV